MNLFSKPKYRTTIPYRFSACYNILINKGFIIDIRKLTIVSPASKQYSRQRYLEHTTRDEHCFIHPFFSVSFSVTIDLSLDTDDSPTTQTLASILYPLPADVNARATESRADVQMKLINWNETKTLKWFCNVRLW